MTVIKLPGVASFQPDSELAAFQKIGVAGSSKRGAAAQKLEDITEILTTEPFRCKGFTVADFCEELSEANATELRTAISAEIDPEKMVGKMSAWAGWTKTKHQVLIDATKGTIDEATLRKLVDFSIIYVKAKKKAYTAMNTESLREKAAITLEQIKDSAKEDADKKAWILVSCSRVGQAYLILESYRASYEETVLDLSKEKKLFKIDLPDYIARFYRLQQANRDRAKLLKEASAEFEEFIVEEEAEEPADPEVAAPEPAPQAPSDDSQNAAQPMPPKDDSSKTDPPTTEEKPKAKQNSRKKKNK